MISFHIWLRRIAIAAGEGVGQDVACRQRLIHARLIHVILLIRHNVVTFGAFKRKRLCDNALHIVAVSVRICRRGQRSRRPVGIA